MTGTDYSKDAVTNASKRVLERLGRQELEREHTDKEAAAQAAAEHARLSAERASAEKEIAEREKLAAHAQAKIDVIVDALVAFTKAHADAETAVGAVEHTDLVLRERLSAIPVAYRPTFNPTRLDGSTIVQSAFVGARERIGDHALAELQFFIARL